MKELPLTLILRPFNFDTLATFVYQYASDELLEECALGALTIVAAGVIPVILMSRTITRSRPGHRNAGSTPPIEPRTHDADDVPERFSGSGVADRGRWTPATRERGRRDPHPTHDPAPAQLPPDGTDSDHRMPGLDFTHVSHRFGETLAVDDVSIGVEAGELACLLGPSGCGKSTLLRLAAGLEPLRSGRITIGGAVVAEGGAGRQLPPEKRGVGLMFQDYALFPHLTVAQNIGFGLRDKSVEVRDGAWIERALGEVGLAHLGERYPHTLSGGQQQRIALLRGTGAESRHPAARRTVLPGWTST